MLFFVSIRVAEPWTTASVVLAVALGVVLMGVVVWLVSRS
jgi:hypothetical protein